MRLSGKSGLGSQTEPGSGCVETATVAVALETLGAAVPGTSCGPEGAALSSGPSERNSGSAVRVRVETTTAESDGAGFSAKASEHIQSEARTGTNIRDPMKAFFDAKLRSAGANAPRCREVR